MLKDKLENINDLKDHLAESIYDTPDHIRGVIITDIPLLRRVIKIAEESAIEEDRLTENLIKSARLSEESTVFFVKSVLKGDIVIPSLESP